MTAADPVPEAASRPIPSAWERFVAFSCEREGPEALALLRICFGAALVANVAQPLLTGSGLAFYTAPSDGGVLHLAPRAVLTVFRVLPATHEVVLGFTLVALAAAVLLTVGLFTRAAAVVSLLAQIALADQLTRSLFAADVVYRVFAYLFVLAPCGAAFSLDARWRGKALALVAKWPRRLFIAQLTIVYVRTGIVKLGSSWSFTDGYSALYYALNLVGMARWPGGWAARIYPLTQVGTVFTKYWEITFFLVALNLYLRRDPTRGGRVRRWLAARDLRWPYLAVGVFMHLFLLVLMNLGLFSVVMLSLYPALLEPEEARRLVESVLGALRRTRGRRAAPVRPEA